MGFLWVSFPFLQKGVGVWHQEIESLLHFCFYFCHIPCLYIASGGVAFS